MKEAYENKAPRYFDGAREDMVSRLPENPDACILEVGCGFGGTGEKALSQRKCRRYLGVDISEKAAAIARTKLTEVLVGDVETLSLPWPAESVDALLLSEVLEHLTDPWALLKRLNPLLRGGALVMASSPNVSHRSVIVELLRGRWELAESGIMDRTHLRWFTPSSFAAMFVDAGFTVDLVEPVTAMRPRTRLLNRATGSRFAHLFMRQINLVGHKPAGRA